MLGKKPCAVYAYICGPLFFSILFWLQFVFMSLRKNNFSSFFWNDKSNQKKRSVVVSCWRQTAKKPQNVVSMLHSPPFLALRLQCVDYWELGFPIFQQFWQQEGAANAKSLLSCMLEHLCSHHVYMSNTSWSLSTWLCKHYFLLTNLPLHLPFFTFRFTHVRDLAVF